MVVMDGETFAYHAASGKAVMAYTSACRGYLVKKRLRLPPGPDVETLYSNPSNDALLARLPAWEAELGAATASIVLAYIMAAPFPAVPIASFSSLAQLDQGLAAADLDIPGDTREDIRRSRRFLWP